MPSEMKLITERSSKTIQENENHFNYAVQVTRIILQMIGVWPIPKFASNAKKIAIRLQNVFCYFLFAFILVSGLLLIFLKERDFKRRVKMIGPLLNCWMGCMKYSLFIYHAKEIQSCLEQVQQDWQSTVNWNDRKAMLSKARIGRKFVIFSAVFIYIGGLSIRTIVPLSKGRMLTPMNTTFFETSRGRYAIHMEWGNSDFTAMLTMLTQFVMFISFTISIFTNCYVGQLLTDESIKFGLKTSTINWYHLSYQRARSLILIIAISNIPAKISAGGMIEISLCTFSNIMTTSMTYLNLLRKFIT
ncbi:uncharacterized protein LOC109610065 isoform X2 [Camponotus floridanus]|uniref:uncharacterized protein LOC109610065 isoform X2 n=1 Tax=Camponotus floridanus TaxID=104421 RepID=UPI000DC67B7B|nr:uncharacterized protein LOC109610065 isoform X2 [Camponotus floridanus]